MSEQASISGPENLGAAVEGKSDDEINAMVEAGGGAERLLEMMFKGMEAAFVPERAAGQSAVVQYDITAPAGVISWHLNVTDDKLTAMPGAAESPRLTLGLSLADFLRLAAGKLDGMTAFMSGKLKLTGDMMFAPVFQSWLTPRT